MANNPVVDYDGFIMVFPVFAGIDQTIIDYWIDDAELVLCKDALGKYWRNAVYFYVAHYLHIAGYSGGEGTESPNAGMTNSGVIDKHQVGDVSVQFNNSALACGCENGIYKNSPYAAQLNAIIRRTGVQVLNTGVLNRGYACKT